MLGSDVSAPLLIYSSTLARKRRTRLSTDRKVSSKSSLAIISDHFHHSVDPGDVRGRPLPNSLRVNPLDPLGRAVPADGLRLTPTAVSPCRGVRRRLRNRPRPWSPAVVAAALRTGHLWVSNLETRHGSRVNTVRPRRRDRARPGRVPTAEQAGPDAGRRPGGRVRDEYG